MKLVKVEKIIQSLTGNCKKLQSFPIHFQSFYKSDSHIFCNGVCSMCYLRKGRYSILPLVVFFFFLTIWVTATPKISCPEPIWKFRKAMEGEKVKHSYKIQNKGTDILQINEVRGSCGCTDVRASSKSVSPGGETTIDVDFNTTGRYGKQTKYIYVKSNDPTTSVLRLTLSGEVQKKPAPEIALRPYSWNILGLKVGESRNTTVSIMNIGDRPLEIKSITTSRPAVRAKLLGPTAIAPAGRVNMEIFYTPDMETGVIRDHINIESNDPKRKVYTFLLYGRIDYESSGLTISVIGAQKEGDNSIIDLHFRNSQNNSITVKIPDAQEPNTAVVAGGALRKFSVIVPTKKIMETKTVPAKTPELKMPLVMPTPGIGDIGSLKIEVQLPIRQMVKEKPVSVIGVGETSPKPTPTPVAPIFGVKPETSVPPAPKPQ